MANVDRLEADLILLHAPSVFDFRERDDLLFAYLSDSDSVNVTGIYEMFPLGFFSLKGHLAAHGLKVEVVNLASLMLQHPDLDVPKLLGRLCAPVFGIDVHWMPHCQGAIEVARLLKRVHPGSKVVVGGISATYFAEQIARHDAVDVIVKGYDTLEPVRQLVETVKRGSDDYSRIPNLVYRDGPGRAVQVTPFIHKPQANYNDSTVDWSFFDAASSGMTNRQIMTLPNTGCAYDCNWCGGSRYAYQHLMGVTKTLVYKDIGRITSELGTLGSLGPKTSIYALQCYSESKARMSDYLAAVREAKVRSVHFEQFQLTEPDLLDEMGRSTQPYIMLSPESHDPEISRLAGRGTYSMEEMEAWLPRAWDAGVRLVVVWFFIGMRKQTPDSVMQTVDYCERLMAKFPDQKVLPLLCPMVPFLDPGSRFFEEPETHGYRIFHRTFDEHRAAMVEPTWEKRLNYETVWMSRRDLQHVSYRAIARLVQAKANCGFLPRSLAATVLGKIQETEALLLEVDACVKRDGRITGGLRDVVRQYNRTILGYSSDQIIPTERPFGGRWFDDYTVPPSILDACTNREHGDDDSVGDR